MQSGTAPDDGLGGHGPHLLWIGRQRHATAMRYAGQVIEHCPGHAHLRVRTQGGHVDYAIAHV